VAAARRRDGGDVLSSLAANRQQRPHLRRASSVPLASSGERVRAAAPARHRRR